MHPVRAGANAGTGQLSKNGFTRIGREESTDWRTTEAASRGYLFGYILSTVGCPGTFALPLSRACHPVRALLNTCPLGTPCSVLGCQGVPVDPLEVPASVTKPRPGWALLQFDRQSARLDRRFARRVPTLELHRHPFDIVCKQLSKISVIGPVGDSVVTKVT